MTYSCLSYIISIKKVATKKGKYIMEFFEELKRTASDVADRAVKKTNEVTSIAKLNLNIKSSNAKLNSVYMEIGKLFYIAERSGEDYTSEIAENIIKADELIALIDAYKKKLAILKNVVECESCGNEIPYSAAFCSFCGAKQEHQEPEEPETDDFNDTPTEDIADENTEETEEVSDGE